METAVPTVETGYAPVNGLEMYYESHGAGGTPLILIHGAFSAIGTSFGALLPGLAATRRVVAIELQGHGRTADIDRPMSLEVFADDIAALLSHLGIASADLFGYSLGAAVALHAAIRHPRLVRRVVHLSSTYQLAGIQPGLMDGLGEMSWEIMKGSPWYEEYRRIAPRPDDFPKLFEKKSAMDKGIKDIPDAALAAVQAPILIALGDADLPTAEHAIQMFRRLGGGGFGDTPAGRPSRSELAIIPGASHVSAPTKTAVLLAIVPAFLDAP